MTQDMNHTIVKVFRAVFMAAMMSLTGSHALAQTQQTGVRVNGNVYGGGNAANVGKAVTVNISAGTIEHDVYGGGAKANTNVDAPNAIYSVAIKKGESVVGYYTDEECNTAATGTAASDETYYRKNVTTVNMTGGTVSGDVYGGGHGALAEGEEGQTGYVAPIPANVHGAVTVNVNGGTAQNVFGCNNLYGAPQSTVAVNIEGGTINNNVFGGGNLADAPGAITVNVTGGTVTNDVYGGGALASTNTANWDPTNGSTGAWVDATKKSALYTTTIKLTGGIIRDVYGGGLGDANTPAYVWGNVRVDLNGTTTDSGNDVYVSNPISSASKGCIVSRIFGCNNVNGTPKGKVLVHVHSTQSGDAEATKIANTAEGDKNKVEGRYDVSAVYGGGNEAAYDPVIITGTETEAVHAHTHVVIEGCDLTSIETVYGGGNAASTPSTKVEIIGSFEINEVFGGGNGKDPLSDGSENLGANVGYYTYENPDNATTEQKNAQRYGFGKAEVEIGGGIIHSVYGGSNKRGNVREVAVAMLERVSEENCFKVDEAYGGGKAAPMDGRAELKLGCIPGVGEVYGGARDADVNNDVVLTITNGTYNRIFGGNNEGHSINGTITVNIEETGCTPIIIGQLFGGGNQAAYTAPFKDGSTTERKDGPTLNIKSFTSIGELYGGGFSAQVTGDTHININEIVGSQASVSPAYAGEENKVVATYKDANNVEQEIKVTIPAHTSGQIGAIGNVYGGGYGANVEGNTYVYIGTESKVAYESGSDHEDKNVAGANITGDVFGGGFGHDTNVSGTAYINVGEVLTEEDPDTHVVTVTGYKDNHATFASGKGIYGGSALGTVANTQVNLYAGDNILCNVYGGGKGQLASGTEGSEGYIAAQSATVTSANVSLYNATMSGSIYGGCNDNGTTTTAVVNLIGGTIGTDGTAADKVFGGGQGHETMTTTATVNVGTSTSVGSTNIYSNVYGGSALGAVGTTNVNLNKVAALTGDVFGGGMGRYTDGAGDNAQAMVTGTATVNLNEGFVLAGNIYGGCNIYGETANAVVNLIEGTVGTESSNSNVFGGGKGSETTFASGEGKGTIIVNMGTKSDASTPVYGGSTLVYGDIYGGSENGSVQDVDVNLYGGTVQGNVYGGGYDTADGKTAANDVTVELYGTVFNILTGSFTTDDNESITCPTTGRVFGCNNLKGSPVGHALVHVYRTASRTGQAGSEYDLAAVFGGGNQADYKPTDSKKSTEVIIEGCEYTSIEKVYGGGNAAAVPATEVWILGTKKIDTVFGGGNGELGPSHAANVGIDSQGNIYSNNTGGSGKAETKLVAGNVTTVYGGSNSNGDVTGGSWISMPQKTEYSGYSSTTSCCDNLLADNIYGGGKNANMSGGTNIILGCQPDHQIDEIYAGSQHADISGDVSLTITSGKFARVFGGNRDGGRLMGSITVNIEETGGCDIPIIIGELYGGGNLAPYSIYGYKNTGTESDPVWAPRESATDDGTGPSTPYDNPRLNVRSFTSIGKIFGGGYKALMVADPTVDINVVKGSHYNDAGHDVSGSSYYSGGTMTVNVPATATTAAETLSLDYPAHEKGKIGAIENVFGGGNLATVIGSATVNIGTEPTVMFVTEPNHLGTKGTGEQTLETSGVAYIQRTDGLYEAKSEGANITGNVYGGGNLADVTGSTEVNICAKEVISGTTTSWQSVSPGTAGVTIAGNVYGGGKGVARESGDRAFFCEEAMVGIDGTNSATNNNSSTYANYGTHVRIGNGTIGNGTTGGNVYGGGEIGRVEFHTEVVIGLGEGTGAATKSPVINGSVFGAGKGTNTHGYSGLVRGDSRVTIQGDAKVGHSVYGGGEMASVGKYEVVNGLPKTPLFGGKCTVTIGGYAEIGPDGMLMTQIGGPDDTGHVFGAGKGTLPYENVTGTPWSMQTGGKVTYDESYTPGTDGLGYEAAYYKFIQSLGLASNSDVTIGGQAFVKGSVYGGSENGYLQANTHVTISGGQIGEGLNKTAPYADADFIDPSTTPVTTDNALATCATWTYDKTTTGNPYDKYAGTAGYDAKGGATTATDGHTYYGNVFGGGRGVVPFAAGKWHRAAGSVAGNTQVDIIAGHILSSVYGGNENTDVGSYALGTDGEPTTTLSSGGTCTINITGGTVGVPRTKEQIEDNPVIGNVFGAGKGDKRVLFNTWTNVGATSVNISGTAKIYGSVFGGGEDGHVIGNAVSIIGGTVTTGVVGNTTEHAYSKVVIGSTGISGADGNVFGGGRGSETALTAGVVGGNVNLTIDNGNILGSVYGGGRLASVGTNFTNPTLENGEPDPRYGELQTPDADHGNIIVTVNDGTIGSSTSTGVNGNIFGGSKGTETNWKLGIARSTTVYMTGGTAYASVYGGGELAQVVGSHTTSDQTLGTEINISGGTIGISGKGKAIWGNVYGGGKGNTTHVEAGLVKTNTKVAVSETDATNHPTLIYHNIYGGGAYGSVGEFDYDATTGMPTGRKENTTGGIATITITGGTIGSNGNENGMIFGSSRGDVGAPNSIHDKLAWVYDTQVTINGGQIKGSVYGGGENGHNYHDAVVNIQNGTIGIASGVPIGTYTSGGASYPYRGNVYGGGCGTDKYYQDPAQETHDGNGQLYNPLAGIVRGNATITMTGGTVVRNIYGAGAMGSVGTMTKDNDDHLVISSGGKTTIEISGGTVGVSGTVEDGNVFGAARGDVGTAQTDVALVKTTGVTISQAEGKTTRIYGNVYGGGALGDVGTYYTITEAGENKGNNIYLGGDESGVCTVTVTGGTIGSEGNTTVGHVFGAGKGDATTYTCQRAMVKGTTVTVSNGTIYGNVYGGGEVGRVEHDAVVTIGTGTGSGPFAPIVHGSVFGAGAGLETHGYSALVRGNSTVTVQGNAKVRKNVYGGGETATVGKYWVSKISPDPNEAPPAGFPDGMPYKTRDGGLCTVTIQGDATVGPDEVANVSNTAGHVFGAGKGVVPHYVAPGTGQSQRMNSDGNWESFATEDAYLQFIETLALASNTNVTIGGNAAVKGSVYGGSESGFVQDHTIVTINKGEIGTAGTYAYSNIGNIFGGGRGISGNPTAGRVGRYVSLTVNDGTAHGSVYGGGEMGVVKENVTVNILGGTIDKDVYGGGALAHTQTGNWNASSNTWVADKIDADGKTVYKTIVNLTGGKIYGDAYGGGLGDLATRGTGHSDVAALVCGDVFVTLDGTAFDITKYEGKDIVKSGRVFGCNNLNGSPKGDVTVTVNKTVTTASGVKRTPEDPNNTGRPPMGEGVNVTRSYELAAVYGGGNLADYEAEGIGRKTHVIINSCDVSINQVYGGGNAAKVPETDVLVNGAYEIHQVFGGGNGADMYTLDNGASWKVNPGADIDGNANTLMKGGYIHEAYGGSNEKGTITGNITIDTGTGGLAACPVQVDKLVGAGKNADVNGNLIIILGCKDNTKIPIVYGGADNAHVNGNVELTITSGRFGQVFGGNNLGGVIKGHIYLNIEETSDCTPIIIDDLYLGGNQAAYSRYGYYVQTTTTEGEGATGVGAPGEEPVLNADAKLILLPRTSIDDRRKPVNTYTFDEVNNKWTWTLYPETGDDAFKPYEQPVLNVTSCTSIGRVFGGGLGEGAAMYADPTVNINMIPGKHAEDQLGGEHKLGQIGIGYTDTNGQRVEGGVFGGGNEAAVYGNTTVNVGTEKTVKLHLSVVDANTGEYTMSEAKNVEGANILSNVYGGGNEADVTGNTYVNVCAKEADDASTADVIEYKGVTISGTGYEGVTIAGNVFGGGKGIADSFTCAKAMIGKDGDGIDHPEGGTHVTIGNGTVMGNVYGGGEIGRVEKNTVVTIGLADVGSGESAPVIKGNVFGGGMGKETHGYAALVRGNPTVTIQADAKVEHNVYGGGQIASVARYNVPRTEGEVEDAIAQGYDAHLGMPYALANTTSGNCHVTVKDNAIIGPDTPMKMYHSEITDGSDEPDDAGHVFGAGKGILPENYTYVDKEHKPKRMVLRDETIHTDAKKGIDWEYVDPSDDNNKNVWEYFANRDAYIIFIQTLALSSYANVTIGDDTSKPFVKGSVYGGSENGLVQFDTKVYIKSGQIGWGKYAQDNAQGAYGDNVWADNYTPLETIDLECPHWDYGLDTNGDNKKDLFAPYDPYANAEGVGDVGKYPVVAGQTVGKSTEGGRKIASDGHTYYGNVFGGGSGSVPYFDTTEGISKYLNSAGTVKGDTYVEISGGHILTNVYGGCEATNVVGTAKVTMTGGTLGVPRTPQQIKDHPVTCYLFGAGKGDQRIYFNKETNVNDAIVNVEGGRIYGSVFGGGEDGHVLRNTTVTIGKTDGTGPKIGTVGSTYVDGNVFGGGRGFGGEALTAGNVGGSVDLIINGGTMLGSVYGGGRLASVGYGLYLVNEEVGGVKPYGKMREDNEYDGSYPDPSPEAASAFYTKGRGHITVNINGGTIGSDVEDEHSGNVFGGSMGRLTKIDGSPFDDSDHWSLLATAKTTEVKIAGGTIKRNVYGGGEMGTVTKDATVTISGGTIGKAGSDNVEIGNVFGGGKGYLDPAQTYVGAGIVKGNTNVAIQNGTSGSTTTTPTIYQNVYGGGELGYVGMFTTPDHKEYTWTENTGLCTVGVAGGMITGHVFGAGKGHDDTFECERAMVRTTSVAVSDGTVGGNVYGGGEVGRVDQNSAVTIGPATGDSAPTITGSVFGAGAGVETHGYSALVRGNTAVVVQGNAKVGNSVYGGGQIAAVGRYGLDGSGMPSTLVRGGECVVTVQGNAVIGANGIGNVFGAGMGVDESKKTYTYADNANRPKRMMTYASGLYTDANKALWEFSDATHTYVWEYFDTKTKYLNFLQTLALATDTRLTINGNASVKGSVYGGSESGFVQRDTEVKILGGEILTVKDAAGNITEGNVFGGGKGISDNDAAGRVRSDTRITVLDGTINGDVYGGGALGKANTLSATNTTIVNLLGGTINGDVYGGGLGNATTAADVGNTKVNLNGMTTEELNSFSGDFKTLLTTTLTGLKEFTKKGAVVKGNVFGANNVNGTPKGHVLVHVHGTQNENTAAINAKVEGEYDVLGVYGGGNQSDYVPTDTKQSTEVIIEGCDLTSIDEVYGGGYGAATPATSVLVKGTKIINNVYGGGYGASTDTYTNPGANVGYRSDKALYDQGTGKAIVQLMAGTINNVYGGSNTLGDIRGGSSVTNVANDGSDGCCEKLTVGEIYGGGKQADMYGGAEIVLGCMPNDWIGAIYAGAENADIGGDVGLTLTSGKFERVFGGNNKGGKIDGYIEVNIEENPDCETPIIIGELYGGGNMAPYAVPAKYTENNPDYLSPRVNVRAFTSIGNIYGGGLGANATVTGNPLVNINEVAGGKAYAGETRTLDDGTTVTLYERKADGKMGVIGNVFGGGNAAKVIGNTNVRIGTNAEEPFESLRAADASVPKKPVLGADIRGNIYGGGNNAEVEGKTDVVIGQKKD